MKTSIKTTLTKYITKGINLPLLLALFCLLSSTTALAQDNIEKYDEEFSKSNDILFYKPEPECGPSTLSNTLGSGSVAKYKNPVIGHTAPDPSIIYGDDGKFHLYTTGFQHFISKDMVNWSKQTKGGDWINIQNNPGWSDERWAPDISKVDDLYVLSFSGGSGGVRKTGYATSKSANGPFKYQGELLHPSDREKNGSGYDIDPNIVQTSSGILLYYGSGTGSISVVKLTRSGDRLTAKQSKVAFTSKKGESPVKAEGAFVHKKGEFYYLYFSSGDWRNQSGIGDAYKQRVARSTSPTQ